MKTGLTITVLACVVYSGCSDHMYGLSSPQKSNLRDWQAAGQEVVVEKKPETATVLSLFIGFGAFYTDAPVLGVVDLLLWPISPLWEIWIAPSNANRINYQATKDAWDRRQRQESMQK